ncbi:MAG: HAD hydrolase family protein [Lachnospiraceae bacterium]|nr:HAD hydrolase family protein [Lachnospiraceae bacterium]
MKNDFSNIRCIAFDLDDTVLNAKKELSGRNADALRRAKEKGLALVPITGRTFSTIPACIRELNGVSLAVTSNGAVIYDLRVGERIHELLLPADTVRILVGSIDRYFREGRLTYEAFVDGVSYAQADYVEDPPAFGIPKSAAVYVQQTRHPVPSVIDFILEHTGCLDSLNLVLKDTRLFPVVEDVIYQSTDNVYITSSISYRMEISHADSGKVSGLTYVLDRLHLTLEETLAFGDGENDAEMLNAAGIGVALQNASASCKASADYTTKLTSGEDGVADFLEQHIL